MNRMLLALTVALTTTSCGLAIDGAYLMSNKTTTKDEEQRRPTGETQTKPERRLRYDQERVGVVCEDVTFGVDRVWNVQKTYEYRGGWPGVHLLPVVIEGLIGGGLAVALGAKCKDPTSNISCDLLYATIPFAVDVTYSLIRALTIAPPKLINKTRGEVNTDLQPNPLTTIVTACEPDTELVATAASSEPLKLHVESDGWIADEDQIKLQSFLLKNPNALVAVYGRGKQLMPERTRCMFFAEQNAGNPRRSIPADCSPK